MSVLVKGGRVEKEYVERVKEYFVDIKRSI